MIKKYKKLTSKVLIKTLNIDRDDLKRGDIVIKNYSFNCFLVKGFRETLIHKHRQVIMCNIFDYNFITENFNTKRIILENLSQKLKVIRLVNEGDF